MEIRIPTCRNPKCPKPNIPLKVLEETPTYVLFACEPCRDINGVLSVQYQTTPKGWERARYFNRLRGVERIQNINKFRTKKIQFQGGPDHAKAI